MKRFSAFSFAFCLCLAASARADFGASLAPASVVSDFSVPETNSQTGFSAPIVWSALNGGNGHLYMLTPTRGTWTTEEAAAETMGGTLVSINSQAEQDFLNSNFLVGNTATVPLWIGLTDLTPAGSAGYSTWVTGESVAYTNFNPDEPNSLNSGEHYIAMNWHYSFGSSATMGTWNDLPNEGSTVSYNPTNDRALGPYYGIVEIVPEPGTVWTLALAGALLLCRKVRRLVRAH